MFREISHEAFGDARFTDTYYISHLGTAPEMERRGLAGGMIRELVERAHGEGREVTLVTMTPELVSTFSTQITCPTSVLLLIAGRILHPPGLQMSRRKGLSVTFRKWRDPDPLVGVPLAITSREIDAYELSGTTCRASCAMHESPFSSSCTCAC